MRVKKQPWAFIGPGVLIVNFLVFLTWFSLGALLSAPAWAKTGFLVVAGDRGFLGNQELDALVERFRQHVPARLALIGKNRQGVEDYAEYVERALAELVREGATEIIAIPLFVSGADATLQRYRQQVPERFQGLRIRWASPMVDSHLTAQILLDRVTALSRRPEKERLLVVGAGAWDEEGARRIETELRALLREVTDRFSFRETEVVVYYDPDAPESEARNEAAREKIVHTAAKRGRTLLVPFVIGVKFDQRMSVEGWLRREFGTYDIQLGETVLPHPEVLTWLRHTANRYTSASRDEVAVLVMPHGATRPYNEGLERVLDPLRSDYRIEMAPGMGDALILQQAVSKLEEEGYRRIVFVRFYALEEHMKARTDYILGLRAAPPSAAGSPPPRVRSSVVFATFGGYEESPLIAEVLRDRILEISQRPAEETVILLAHGRREDEADRRWREVMEVNIERIQDMLERPFRSIKAMTLREDWPELRAQALARIREEIETINREGGRVLVISNRLYGSGPYRRLLGDLQFVMNDRGLVPHPLMTRWLREGIERLLPDLLRPQVPGGEASIDRDMLEGTSVASLTETPAETKRR